MRRWERRTDGHEEVSDEYQRHQTETASPASVVTISARAAPTPLPCERQGQKVRPTECYVCWHNQGTMLPKDCRLRRTPVRVKVRT